MLTTADLPATLRPVEGVHACGHPSCGVAHEPAPEGSNPLGVGVPSQA